MYSNDPRIKPYEFRGLKGRYVYESSINSNEKRVFLIVYGQHASIERCVPLVEALSRFGDVYLADVPGFGGMEPAYKIGEKPELSFFAANIKNVFDTILPKDKKVTVFGISYGLQQVTQFLHDYPEYIDRLEGLISFVGLVSYKDIRISKTLEAILKNTTVSAKTHLGSKFYQHLIFRYPFVRTYYMATAKKNPKFSNLSKEKIAIHASEQAWLWQINERRTHAQTAHDFLFKTDLTNLHIKMPITHIGVPNDHLLNNEQVVKDLKKIFTSVEEFELDLPGHSPISLESAEKILALFPKNLSNKLKKSDNK